MCSMKCDILDKNILDLPDDVLFAILSFCDQQTLGRLSRVCQRLRNLSQADHVWLPLRRNMLTVLSNRKAKHLSVKDQCRISYRWFKAQWNNVIIGLHRIRQMPCLTLLDNRLLTTYNNSIRCYSQAAHKKQGRGSPFEIFYTHKCDISRLVAEGKHVVIGDRNGNILVKDATTGESTHYFENAHDQDVLALAFSSNVIVSGSRDTTVKVWRLDEPVTSYVNQPFHTISLEDRVCCTAVDPAASKYIIGTAGIKFLPPLQLWDLKRHVLLGYLGEDYRHGAGIMDAEFESPHHLLSCGYDTIVRLWDLRMPYLKCALSMEDVYDETVYCVRSAGEYAVLSGMARHGLVELWDKRSTKKPVQLYFTGGSGSRSSPVYSLALDSTCLYVGLDLSIRMLDFDI